MAGNRGKKASSTSLGGEIYRKYGGGGRPPGAFRGNGEKKTLPFVRA